MGALVEESEGNRELDEGLVRDDLAVFFFVVCELFEEVSESAVVFVVEVGFEALEDAGELVSEAYLVELERAVSVDVCVEEERLRAELFVLVCGLQRCVDCLVEVDHHREGVVPALDLESSQLRQPAVRFV